MASQDLSIRKVSNALTLGAFLFGLIYMLLSGKIYFYGQPVSSAFWGLVVAFLLTLPGYVTKTLGGGDVKLLVAIAVLCGVKVVVASFVLASLGMLAGLLVWRYFSPHLIATGWVFVNEDAARKKRYIPFGAALALAMCVVIVFPDIWGMTSWHF